MYANIIKDILGFKKMKLFLTKAYYPSNNYVGFIFYQLNL